MILPAPGIKEGYVEKNQPGPGGLGFCSSASSRAKLSSASGEVCKNKT